MGPRSSEHEWGRVMEIIDVEVRAALYLRIVGTASKLVGLTNTLCACFYCLLFVLYLTRQCGFSVLWSDVTLS